MSNKPLVLVIVPGLGIVSPEENNPFNQAKMPNWQKLVREYPVTALEVDPTTDTAVGHLNIGTGRICRDTVARIDQSVQDGSFFTNKILLQAVNNVVQKNSALHLIGLLSTSHKHVVSEHCFAILELAKQQKIKNVFVHLILDGHDEEQKNGVNGIKKWKEKLKEIGVGKIASVSGWFYAMDRDSRWDRTEKAYQAIAGNGVECVEDPLDAISASYSQNVFADNFVPVMIGKNNRPIGAIGSGDSIIFFNHRADRLRQLLESIALPSFSYFTRENISDLSVFSLTEYEKEIPVSVIFPKDTHPNSLGEVIDRTGLKQWRVAESVGFAEITYFLSGERENKFTNEEQIIIPSPIVDSYVEAPKLAAAEVTKTAINVFEANKQAIVFLNYLNFDLALKTGDEASIIKAAETVDKEIDRLADHVLAREGVLIVVGSNSITGRVPFLLVGEKYRGLAGLAGDPPEGDLSLLKLAGKLSDVAPTVLKILKIEQPAEMTGRVLL